MFTHNLIRRTSFTIPSILLAANLALAQEPARSLGELPSKIRIGDNLRVIELNGKKTEGRFDGVSATSLRLVVNGDHRELPESTLREINVSRPDRVWDGALVGGGIGAIGGAVIGGTWLGDCGGDAGCKGKILAAATGVGAGTGALLDYLRQKHETVFVRLATSAALHFSPILSKERKGAMVSVSFRAKN